MFLWGNIAPYVLSYFYHFGSQDNRKEISLFAALSVYPIMTIVLMFMNPTVAYLTKFYSSKNLIGFGSVIAISSPLISA